MNTIEDLIIQYNNISNYEKLAEVIESNKEELLKYFSNPIDYETYMINLYLKHNNINSAIKHVLSIKELNPKESTMDISISLSNYIILCKKLNTKISTNVEDFINQMLKNDIIFHSYIMKYDVETYLNNGIFDETICNDLISRFRLRYDSFMKLESVIPHIVYTLLNMMINICDSVNNDYAKKYQIDYNNSIKKLINLVKSQNEYIDNYISKLIK
jgi:hypothetical protein